MTATHYDPRLIPAAEKGSRDLGHGDDREAGRLGRAREHDRRPTPLNGGGAGAEYEIVGHKWFCSAPMSDIFLVLAQTDDGPVLLPDAADPARRQRATRSTSSA